MMNEQCQAQFGMYRYLHLLKDSKWQSALSKSPTTVTVSHRATGEETLVTTRCSTQAVSPLMETSTCKDLQLAIHLPDKGSQCGDRVTVQVNQFVGQKKRPSCFLGLA